MKGLKLVLKWIAHCCKDLFNQNKLLLSKKLLSVRVEKEILPDVIAELLGISVKSYLVFERGKKVPTLEMVKKIAMYYEIDALYFYDDSIPIQFTKKKINKEYHHIPYELPEIGTSADKLRYEQMVEEISADPLIQWGRGLKVLIMSDRCPGRSKGLYDYLTVKTELNVTLINTVEIANEYIGSKVPDIVIFVGMQKNEDNYQIISRIRLLNPSAFIAMYASLDDIIEQICLCNRIHHSFCSWEPLSLFIDYLRHEFDKDTRISFLN